MQDLLTRIIENKSIQMFQIAEDRAEFERFRNLINGSLKSHLEDAYINNALLSNSVNALKDKKALLILHDESEIRKEYSDQLENLMSVRSLDNKRSVNGYRTINSVASDLQGKSIKLLLCKVLLTEEEGYVSQAELKSKKTSLEILGENSFNQVSLIKDQIAKTDSAFKESGVENIIHILDRGHDSNDLFKYIGSEVQSDFIIRLKMNRNSNTEIINPETNRKKKEKLKDKNLNNKYTMTFKQVRFKKALLFNINATFESEPLEIEGHTYTLLKITLMDKDSKMIFKEPMLLITSLKINSLEEAYFVYRSYMRRSKIESVFKFLKEVLGWEDFRVRDYNSIKTLITLCYFIGGYFYEIEKDLSELETIKILCQMAFSKGKITKHFILKGLQKIADALKIVEYIRNEVDNPDELFDLISQITGMDRKRFDILTSIAL